MVATVRRGRFTIAVACLGLLGLPAGGQTAGTISGTVIDAITKAPLANVKISADFSGASTTSDSEGRFRLAVAAPMTHLVVAEKSGYAKLDGGLGLRVQVGAGSSVNDLVLALSPEAVIAGRLLETKGDASRGISVEVTDADTRASVAYVLSKTKSFRIDGLRAGRYLVSAQPLVQFEAPRLLTYHPSELERGRATVVVLRAGDYRGDLDITLREVQFSTIRGRYAGANPVPPGCMLTYDSKNRDPIGSTMPVKLDGQGQFAIRVPRGDFRLKVFCLGVSQGGSDVLGFKDLLVGEQDIDNLLIPPNPQMTVQATLKWSLAGRPDAPTGSLMLNPTKGLGVLRFSRLPGNGLITVANVTPDVYLMSVGQLPSGSYVQSILTPSGEVLLDGLDLLNGTATDLEIVVASDGGTIRGQVRDAKRIPVLGAQVAIRRATSRPSERELWSRFTAVDGAGQFAQPGIAPGDYEVTARVGGRVSSPQRVSIGPSAQLEIQLLLPD